MELERAVELSSTLFLSLWKSPAHRAQQARPCPSPESAAPGYDPCPRRPLPASLASFVSVFPWSLGGKRFQGFSPRRGNGVRQSWGWRSWVSLPAGRSHREGR